MDRLNILDASAILAYLQQEKGEEFVEKALDEGPCLTTTVNACEVLSKLCEKGMPPHEAQAAFLNLGLLLVDFDLDLAQRAAAMRPQTMPIGDSLGDRACLALAQRAAEKDSASVYTTEHGWTRLKWPFQIVLLRPPKRSA